VSDQTACKNYTKKTILEFYITAAAQIKATTNQYEFSQTQYLKQSTFRHEEEIKILKIEIYFLMQTKMVE